MDKHKVQSPHWTVLDNDGNAKSNYKKNIKKYLINLFGGLLGATAGFSLLTIANLSPVFIMIFLGGALSGCAVFTRALQKLGYQIKEYNSYNKINKCANHPQVEKLSKKELEIYKLLNNTREDYCKEPLPINKLSKYYDVNKEK